MKSSLTSMRVIVANDHALVRDTMAALLASWGMNVVGRACSGDEALRQVRGLNPNVVVLEIPMTGRTGWKTSRLIKAEFPQVKILILGDFDDAPYRVAAFDSGADAYLLRETSSEDLRQTLTELVTSETSSL